MQLSPQNALFLCEQTINPVRLAKGKWVAGMVRIDCINLINHIDRCDHLKYFCLLLLLCLLRLPLNQQPLDRFQLLSQLQSSEILEQFDDQLRITEQLAKAAVVHVINCLLRFKNTFDHRHILLNLLY